MDSSGHARIVPAVPVGGCPGGRGAALYAFDLAGSEMNFFRISAARSVISRFAPSSLTLCPKAVIWRNIENKLNFLYFLLSNILLCFIIIVNCSA